MYKPKAIKKIEKVAVVKAPVIENPIKKIKKEEK